jgi:hypothetical protein
MASPGTPGEQQRNTAESSAGMRRRDFTIRAPSYFTCGSHALFSVGWQRHGQIVSLKTCLQILVVSVRSGFHAASTSPEIASRTERK